MKGLHVLHALAVSLCMARGAWGIGDACELKRGSMHVHACMQHACMHMPGGLRVCLCALLQKRLLLGCNTDRKLRCGSDRLQTQSSGSSSSKQQTFPLTLMRNFS